MANAVANLELKDIFEKERLPKSNWQFLSLLLYFPFGLILALLRFVIGCIAYVTSLILSRQPVIRSVTLRVLSLVLGVNVEQDNKQERDKSTRLLVANCVTRFDHVAFYLSTGCVMHQKKSSIAVGVFPSVADFTKGSLPSLEENLQNHLEHSDTPLLIQPEGTTSGKNCLLKFSTQASRVCGRIQPVAVTVERPLWANTAPTVLGSSQTSDLFWFLFSPYTVFRLKYLNVVHRESEETEEEFMERIRKVVADELNLKVSPFTAVEKAEYEKRYLDDLNRAAAPTYGSLRTGAGPSLELIRMTNQVSEVLPNVPRDAIMRDLERTRSIDLTISNILEGAVSYTPYSPQLVDSSGLSAAQYSQASNSASPSTSSSSSSTAAALSQIFPKSSQDRMVSFQERKAKMIEEARLRYIEKKGLVVSPQAAT